MKTWQLHEARNKLGKVIEDALTEGPQLITRRGKPVVIVLSYEAYRHSTDSNESLFDLFRSSPIVDAELDISQDSAPIPDRFDC